MFLLIIDKYYIVCVCVCDFRVLGVNANIKSNKYKISQ